MLDKIITLFSRIGLIVGSAMLAIMVLLTVADIFMRYVFSSPLPDVTELTQIMLSITVFAGFILVSRDGSHIMVSLFESKLNKLAPKLYKTFYALSNTLGTAFILYVLVLATEEAYLYEETTEGLEIPFVWIFSILVVSVSLALVTGIHVFTKGRKGHGAEE